MSIQNFPTPELDIPVRQERFICCLCAKLIPVNADGWAEGNNAAPVIPDGRCCNECNESVVFPTRMRVQAVKDMLDKGTAYIDEKDVFGQPRKYFVVVARDPVTGRFVSTKEQE
jgi:hypothetical protein